MKPVLSVSAAAVVTVAVVVAVTAALPDEESARIGR
jgi:hypothetical protein